MSKLAISKYLGSTSQKCRNIFLFVLLFTTILLPLSNLFIFNNSNHENSFNLNEKSPQTSKNQFNYTNYVYLSPLLKGIFIGGHGIDYPGKILTDDVGNIYLCGTTTSDDFVTTENSYDGTFNGLTDVYCMKISPDGSELLFSTYLGGSIQDTVRDFALNSENNIVITGITQSDDFPMTNHSAFKNNPGQATEYSGFISIINPDSGELLG